MTKNAGTWQLRAENGHVHTVEAVRRNLRWDVRWAYDGVEVAGRTTFDRTPVLDGKEHGALRLGLPVLVGPAQEVALHPNRAGDENAALGEAVLAHRGDGLQFTPAPGSRAEAHLAWVGEHPVQYLLARAGLAVAGLLVPMVLAALTGLIVWQLDIPGPDLPDVPVPDLPDLPDLPALPGWVSLVLPVLLAAGYGWIELRQARKQRSKQQPVEDF